VPAAVVEVVMTMIRMMMATMTTRVTKDLPGGRWQLPPDAGDGDEDEDVDSLEEASVHQCCFSFDLSSFSLRWYGTPVHSVQSISIARTIYAGLGEAPLRLMLAVERSGAHVEAITVANLLQALVLREASASM